jgi:hypothetical protein
MFKPGDFKDLLSKIKIFIDNPQLIKSFSSNINPPASIEDHAKLIEKTYVDIINERPAVQYKPEDYNFDNLYKMNFTQQFNKEVNLHVAKMLEKAIRLIIPFKKEIEFNFHYAFRIFCQRRRQRFI